MSFSGDSLNYLEASAISKGVVEKLVASLVRASHRNQPPDDH